MRGLRAFLVLVLATSVSVDAQKPQHQQRLMRDRDSVGTESQQPAKVDVDTAQDASYAELLAGEAIADASATAAAADSQQ